MLQNNVQIAKAWSMHGMRKHLYNPCASTALNLGRKGLCART